ncbi:CGNR zinc finger domain-containing protein [Yinghuangia seranimata]|uniref:CGNR zinc finger domain-containing protein n=1 Tax=Yinghuangia seranimata TaxID=408067 RepID=UPI00248BD6AB|nr:CGNR zinc finger domain-containing protein [Yinghuangia seranimata]MDI2128098.1 CGNR zinc finger domain-containing protein [Yinghuangia seranimata]
MELSAYADYAVRLVNTEEPARGTDELRSTADIARLLEAVGRPPGRVTESDVPRLRAVRARLRAVFTDAAEGRAEDAVATLNGLLAEYPVHPRVTGHDGRPWHIHLADDQSGAAESYAAVAGMGLAVQLTSLGPDRLGVCEAAPCRNVYVDASANRSRRYCSDRCSTRANVAVFRARRKARAAD